MENGLHTTIAEKASIVVFASGNGSNFEVLARAFPNKIKAVICDKKTAFVLQRAKGLNIPSFIVPYFAKETRAEHEDRVINILCRLESADDNDDVKDSLKPIDSNGPKKIKLIVLAGYMRILSEHFFNEISKKWGTDLQIINLHPAHLDQYKGAHAYDYAIDHRYPRWGLSVHKVTPQVDSGELLHSGEISIFPYECSESFKKRAQLLEHKLLVESVGKILTYNFDY